MGLLHDWLHLLDPLMNLIEMPTLKPESLKPGVPEHPMTYEEYKYYNDCVLVGKAVGNIIRNTHNHFQQQRWHDETIEAIRELKER